MVYNGTCKDAGYREGGMTDEKIIRGQAGNSVFDTVITVGMYLVGRR